MIKKTVALISAVLICLMLCVPAFAVNATYVSFFDGINVKDSQVAELDRMAKEIRTKYDFPAYYFIVDDIGNNSDIYEYTKSIYNEKSAGMSGVCFVAYLNNDVDYTDYSSEQTYLYVTDGAKALFTEDVQQAVYDGYDNASTYYDSVKEYYNSISALLDKNSDKTAQIVEAGETAEIGTILIKDRTGTVSTVQREKLNEKLTAVSNECRCNFYVAITDSLDGMTADEYASKYYADNDCGFGEKKDGVLLLICFDKENGNSWAVYRSKGVEKFYSDVTTKKLMKPVVKKLSAKDHTGAIELYADNFSAQYGKHGSPATYWLPLSFLIGFAIAFIVTKIRTGNLKSVVAQRSAGSYVKEDSIVEGKSNDVFISSDVKRTAKASSNSSDDKGSSTSGKF